jgi:hypothetical protein
LPKTYSFSRNLKFLIEQPIEQWLFVGTFFENAVLMLLFWVFGFAELYFDLVE